MSAITKAVKKHVKTIVFFVCVALAACFIALMSVCARGVAAVPQATGVLTDYIYETTESGENERREIAVTLGEDVAAVRIDEIGALGALDKVNYVPNEFVMPGEVLEKCEVLDLTEPRALAERGSLIFVVLNLDPDAEDFKEKARRLDRNKIGDYWHFTLCLPQIFGASNVYLRSQFVARNGSIADYDFGNYNTNYDKQTYEFNSTAAPLTLDLSFYTRRQAILDGYASAQIITVHYQSKSAIAGLREPAVVGDEDKATAVFDGSANAFVALAILSAIGFAVFVALTALKRTAAFVPELVTVLGVFLYNIAAFGALKRAALPVQCAGLGLAAPFIVLGGALLSVGVNVKRVPARFVAAAVALIGAALAGFSPLGAFGVMRGLNIAAAAAAVVGAVALAVFATVRAEKGTVGLLQIIYSAFTAALAAAVPFAFAIRPAYADPAFWLNACVAVTAFAYVFKIFSDAERRSRYLTDNLHREVERQVEDIKAVVTERDRLLRYVSHDMKKPLRAALAFTDTLIEREKDGEQIKLANIVKQKTNGVLAGLDDIAEYAKFNYIAEPSRAVALDALCAEVCGVLADDCKANGIILINDATERVEAYAKPKGLESALVNIIMNAVEHADCTTITVSAAYVKNKAVLAVADDGKGVAVGDDVFKPYVTESDEETGGLGLYICKSVAEAMNGTLAFERTDGKTVFRIELLRA